MNRNKLFIFFFVIATFFVGVVYSALPHYVRYETLKKEGLRYIPLTVDSTFDHINFAAPRYRDVIDGTLIPGEMDTYEHMGGPILTPILVPLILSPFLLPFDSIFPAIIMSEFLFPILLFVALFFIFNSFTGNKIFSLFSSYVLMLFPQLPVHIPPSSLGELKTLLFEFIPFSGVTASELNFLARDSYIPGGPFFVLMFYFVYRALTDETRRNLFVVLAGIFYGLLFYLYFFFWVFATIFLGILFLTLLATKDYLSAKKLFFVGVVGALVSIPFWINQYHLSNLSSYADIFIRQGIEEGHGIRWFLWKTYVLQLGMAVLAVYLGSRLSRKMLGLFLAAIALTGIVAYNANVVTGFAVQSDHWGNKVFLITNGIVWPALFYCFWQCVGPLLKWKQIFERKVFPIMAILVVLLLTTHVAESSVKENVWHAKNYTVPVGLMDAYAWLTENTPKDSVVMTPSIETNIELAGYTHNRIFQARAQNNLLSRAEVVDRMFITQKLFGVPSERFSEMLKTQRGVFNFFTGEYNSRALDSSLRPERYPIYTLPEDVAEDFLNEYTTFKLPQKIPYRLDYIFVGQRERGAGISEESLSRYEKLYENDKVVIYKYRQF